MNVSIPEFRKQVKFDMPTTSAEQRAKWLLFFVTRVAKLRNDMTPDVVKERLYDWGYNDITTEQITEYFTNNEDIRPSRQRSGAFEVTPVAFERMKKYLKPTLSEVIFRRNALFQLSLMIVSISALILLSLVSYHLATKHLSIRDLSLPEFRKRISFDQATPHNRAKYFLYYITQVVRLRSDMTPKIIDYRLHDLGFDDIKAQGIEKAFRSDTDIRQSDHRKGAFEINPRSYDKFEKKLGLKMPPNERLTLEWLWKHVPVKGWVSLLIGIIGLISCSFSFGYYFATKIQMS